MTAPNQNVPGFRRDVRVVDLTDARNGRAFGIATIRND